MHNSQYSPFSVSLWQKPTACPFCKGKIIDTLAKVITVTSFWRCRECEQTWTIWSRPTSGFRTTSFTVPAATMTTCQRSAQRRHAKYRVIDVSRLSTGSDAPHRGQ